jgi:hypothetical protein
MKARMAVVDWSGNYEENCIQLGKHLGQDKLRRELFNAVYGRGSKPRTKKELMAATGLKAAKSQQAQNQLDILYRYGLVLRDDNDSVPDGSRYAYSKEPHVRAHRHRIVKHADNPKLVKTTPTKRNPVVRNKLVIQRTTITKQALKKHKKVDVLYLMANPIPRHALRVDAEVAKVSEEIRRSLFRDNIALHQSPAANLDSLIRGLNDYRPRIVHFSGHGSADGIAVDDGGIKRVKKQIVTFDILGKALSATDKPPEIVVLNACESAGARAALLGTAKAIAVMQDEISDVAAIAFATKFYGGIASGQSLQSAFDQGRLAVEAVSMGEAATPILITAKGVNPKKLILS